MDFFAQQEQARRRTRFLGVYFLAAVGTIIAVLYLSLAAIWSLYDSARRPEASESGNPPATLRLWRPALLGWVAGGTLLVIGFGSLYKIRELAQGGAAVAGILGGRPVDPNTTDTDERRLRNVVEEMSIASGIPVPELYLLAGEQGINAFAAGTSADNAAIGVTQGCVRMLTRAELQGVIAHEFSHILNGDMRLNTRLIGLTFGILCLAFSGRILLRIGSELENRAAVAFLGGGALLWLLGSIGFLFSRLIKSAIARQREYLADAAAVQFTRDLDGLTGALLKIGGLSRQSRLATPHAEEASHLFFGNALAQPWFSLMATHPPLADRIRRLKPSFDGQFPRISPTVLDRLVTDTAAPRVPLTVASPDRSSLAKRLGALAALPPLLNAQQAQVHAGAPTMAHLAYAEGLIASLPEPLIRATRETFDATALVCVLLLDSNPKVRVAQLQSLEHQVPPEVLRETHRLTSLVADVAPSAKLPLVAMALPALRRLSSAQYQQFAAAVQALIEADQQIDLFEYALKKMLIRHLDAHYQPLRKTVIQYYVLKPLIPDCLVLLSALAQLGQDDPAAAARAFQLGLRSLDLADADLSRGGAPAWDLAQVDAALDRLLQLVPPLRQTVLEACSQTVTADGRILPKEAELLRAIADALDCPLPPFLDLEAVCPHPAS